MFSKVYKWKKGKLTGIDSCNKSFNIQILHIHVEYFFFINCILCEIEYVNLIKKFISNIATKYFSIQTWEVAGFDCDM